MKSRDTTLGICGDPGPPKRHTGPIDDNQVNGLIESSVVIRSVVSGDNHLKTMYSLRFD